jgi:thiol-disulfide isomerase/thioredoxin
VTRRRSTTPRRAPGRHRFPIVPVAIGIAAVALVVSVLLTFDGDAPPDEYGAPTVTGAALPPLAAGPVDPAVGLPAPEVAGADFGGEAVAITDDGRPKILLFLAHWCPHCQVEVPRVESWVTAGNLPDGVDLYAVASSIDPTRPNYPPSRWLEREGWSAPVVVDDRDTTVARSFGLNAYPYWVFVAADGTVWGRISGELGTAVLDDVVQMLTES